MRFKRVSPACNRANTKTAKTTVSDYHSRAVAEQLQFLFREKQPIALPQVLSAIDEQMQSETADSWFHRLPRHRQLLIASNWKTEGARLFAQYWERGDLKSLAAFIAHTVAMRRQFETAETKPRLLR